MKFVPKTKTAMYWIWRGMLLRCSSTHPAHFKKYRAKGIKVCERWLVFENFLEDMVQRPSPKHSIDRIDNNGNYEPDNCRWATAKQQARNRGSFLRPLTFKGRTQLLTDWASELGINISTLSMRINVRKWPVDKALTTSTRRQPLAL